MLYRCVAILVCLSGMGWVSAQETGNLPYIYYYADTLNAIVIERADGTDSRMLGEGLTSEFTGAETIYGASAIDGPGWSPDGEWFAWYGIVPSISSDYTTGAYAIRGDSTSRLEQLDILVETTALDWSPDGRYLFVAGNTFDCPWGCFYKTFWLIDMANEQMVSSFSHRFSLHASEFYFTWLPTNDGVEFYVWDEYSDGPTRYYRVTMRADSTVSRENVDDDIAIPLRSQSVEMSAAQTFSESPDGLYRFDFPTTIVDIQNNTSVEIPRNANATGGPQEVRWSIDNNWLIIAYDKIVTSGPYYRALTVTNVEGMVVRHLTDCALPEVCANWLPERVEVNDLPAGESESVLLAPVAYDYNVEFLMGVGFFDTNFRLMCDPEDDTYRLLQSATNSAMRFRLHDGTHCGFIGSLMVSAVLNPDETLLILEGDERPVVVWDAVSGERIVRLNTYGFEIEFSDDGRYLYTRSRHARLTWEVHDILAQQP